MGPGDSEFIDCVIVELPLNLRPNIVDFDRALIGSVDAEVICYAARSTRNRR